ncbi:ATP-binding cassette domain-containing protein [Streptomyces sp. NPDC047108]|uniref:ATP-binding cassette domain-containing protein n=1 Tax=Streptomyces sp. NPDC047108 TaxID=3155025 RepID=UPI0033F33482
MRLERVGRRYGLRGPWVLRDVDVDIPQRSLLRVTGANGSGKSTLLRLLAGIDAPSTGRVTGRPPTAYVPERFPSTLPFTAVGYLTHLGCVHGLRRDASARRAEELLERFGAGAYVRTPIPELSKGSTQKVAVAQALMAEPDLLVLDEAWTGLDRFARSALDRAVAERVAGGGTVVFVDHDPQRLAGAADVEFRIRDSRLECAPVARPTNGSGGGPRVRVEVEGVPGLWTPDGLPGSPVVEQGTEGRTILLTVPAAHSDGLLRALLGASPPWHVLSVTRTDDVTRPGTETPPEGSSEGSSEGLSDGSYDGSSQGSHDDSYAGGTDDAVTLDLGTYGIGAYEAGRTCAVGTYDAGTDEPAYGEPPRDGAESKDPLR